MIFPVKSAINLYSKNRCFLYNHIDHTCVSVISFVRFEVSTAVTVMIIISY
jgi:hypothetical protein